MTLNFPNSPTSGDQFTGSNNYIYEYDGEKWNFVKLVGGDFSSSAIQDGAVTTAKIADDAITTNKIPNRAVTTDKIDVLAVTTGRIENLAVTTAKIADDAVTASKLSPTIVFVPTGAIVAWPSATPPSGWVECRGQSASAYPALAAIVGSNIPDLRDQFIRGSSSTRSVGSSQGYSTARPVSSAFTTNDPGNHTHSYSNKTATQRTDLQGSSDREATKRITAGNIQTGGDGSHTHTINGGGDSETRPVNIALMFIIKI